MASKSDMDDDLVKIIKASKDLQQKVGTGTVETQMIEKAEKVIVENKVDFAPIAKPQMDQLKAAIAEAKKDTSNTKKITESLSTPIMNIKANAATFNYPLVSGLTDAVLTFLEEVKNIDKKTLQIADLLHMTITLILARKMSGDGGNEGKALLAAFRDVCRKHAAKMAKAS